MIKVIGRTEKNKRLLFFVFSAINFDKAVGKPNCPSPINKEKVGRIIMYRPNPSVPINLDITIFMIIPNTFVKRPPMIRIRIDFINFSFIVHYMIFFN